MPVFANRVMETSTTTGTSDYTLAAAVAGYQAFADALDDSTRVWYTAEAVDGNGTPTDDYEIGIGTYDTGVLSRDEIYETRVSGTSTLTPDGSGTKVTWAAGTRRVFISSPAGRFGDSVADLVQPEMSVTGDTTLTAAAYGRVIHVHGLSADITITLPTAVGYTGAHLEFRFEGLNGYLVTLDGNGSQTVGDGALTRTFWEGEAYKTRSDGANQQKVWYDFRAMQCTMFLTANAGGYTTGTAIVVALDGVALDNTGLMAVPIIGVVGQINFPRTGTFLAIGMVRWSNFSAPATRVVSILQNSDTTITASAEGVASTGSYSGVVVGITCSAVKGDYVQLLAFQNSGSTQTVFGDVSLAGGGCFLTLLEQV